MALAVFIVLPVETPVFIVLIRDTLRSQSILPNKTIYICTIKVPESSDASLANMGNTGLQFKAI